MSRGRGGALRGLAVLGLLVASAPALLTTGCLSRILEAPYVLTPGLGEARSLAPTEHNTMLVASSTGLHEVDGEGQIETLWEGEAKAVTTHLHHAYVLTPEGLRVGKREEDGAAWEWSARPLQGAVDVLAWCDRKVLAARADAVLQLDLAPGGEATPWATGLHGLRGLALDAGNDCDSVLAFSDYQLLRVHPDGRSEVLLDGLVELRATATDGEGRLWMVHGTPPRLSVLVDGKPREYAHYLGDPRDLHFGSGDLLKPDNVYLADGGGTLDYLHVVPPGASAP